MKSSKITSCIRVTVKSKINRNRKRSIRASQACNTGGLYQVIWHAATRGQSWGLVKCIPRGVHTWNPVNCAVRAQLRLTLAERVLRNWPGIGNEIIGWGGGFCRKWSEILCGISLGFLFFPDGCLFHIISLKCAIRAQLRLTLPKRVVRN